MALTGPQKQTLREALSSAFTRRSLQIMLTEKLNKRLDLIVDDADLTFQVFQLIQAAEMEGWLERLLLAAREAVPGRTDLVVLSQLAGIGPAGAPSKPELEAMIDKAQILLNPVDWRMRMAAVEGRVCRIKIKGRPKGTGFLVGPEAVLTNWHVVKAVAEQQNGLVPADISLQFDYKRLADGTELSPGKEYALVGTPDWLLDHSPWSKVDEALDPKPGLPDPDELDYALLRASGEPGHEALGSKPFSNPDGSPAAGPRGWIAIPDTAYSFADDTPLGIMEHPLGAPLLFQMITNGVMCLNENQTRVRHRINTEHGSSGSPLFDQNWNLVALHHAGDPNSVLPTYNEGIPIKLVAARIAAQGKGSFLGEAGA